jgi:hypothetical protein
MLKAKDIAHIIMIILRMIGKNIEKFGKRKVIINAILRVDLIAMNLMKKKVN